MSSMWRLPEEIQVDIFLRLPVNSILSCRCVCKPLCSLLSKPSFIKNHLNRSIQTNNRNPRLMFDHSRYHQHKNPIINSVDYNSISSSAVSEVKVVTMAYPFEKRNTKDILILGSCDGIICLGISSYGNGIDQKNRICIWNPATGEFMNIKLPLSELRGKSSYFFRYGFGYDINIDDYKLVRISGYENCPGKKIEVYRLGSECWRTVQSTDPCIFLGSNCWKTMQSAEPYIFSGRGSLHGVLINGVLHWSGATATTVGTSTKLIVCFDINSEILMDIPFPEETILPLQNCITRREVGMFGNCLCVVFSIIEIRTDIWVMQDYGVRESWTKVFTTTQQTITRDPFFKPIWSFENGDILVHSCKKLTLCNDNNGNTTRKVLFDGINMGSYPESYVESLVSFKSRTYVKQKPTNHNKKKPKRQRT
ncbi:F-box protein CPR1-like [Papaver somniferum]|uniref:F-box protein CPR1-like n=1 Tax=Papaver somniferum TaxID=3469 RepID=UPI000E6FD7E3|nr:F-box protein CPR1-like [Papaver somniferum]